MEKRSKLDDLLDCSIKKSIINKENQKLKKEKTKIRKSKKTNKDNKNESSDEEFNLPRRRVMTLAEFNKRKRVMTKYEKELMKEREEERLDAMLNSSYDGEDYEDSLKDFVVNEKSMFIDSQLADSSSEKLNTSNFIDEDCEIEEEEIEGSCGDEEMEIYNEINGIKDFYNDSDLSDEDYQNLNKKTFSDDSHFSSSDDEIEIKRKVTKKRNKFINDEVSLADSEDAEDEIDDSEYSDLKSFINDNDVTIFKSSDDETEPETNTLNTSCSFIKKKRKKRKICQLNSDDEVESQKITKPKLKKLSDSNESLSENKDSKSFTSSKSKKSSLFSDDSEDDRSKYEIISVNKIKENGKKQSDSEEETKTETNFTFESNQMEESLDSDSIIPNSKIKSKSFISSSESEDENLNKLNNKLNENKTINLTETILDLSSSIFIDNDTVNLNNEDKYGKIESDIEDYASNSLKFNKKDSLNCKIDSEDSNEDSKDLCKKKTSKKKFVFEETDFSDNSEEENFLKNLKVEKEDLVKKNNKSLDNKNSQNHINDKNYENKMSWNSNQSNLFEDSVEFVFSETEDKV